jgi:signal transduction histidine kinase
VTWNYAYTPHIWPSIFTLLLVIALAVFAWRRRTIPGAIPFIIGCLFAALWVTGSVLEFAALDPAAKIFWFKFQSVWQLPSVTASTCFILEYAWPGRWLKRRNLALLSIAPLVLVLLVLTNDLNHLAWSGFITDSSVLALRGPGIWLTIAYGYGLGLINLVVLAWLFLRSPQHRWPAALMVTGQIGVRIVYFLQQAYLVRSDLPLDVIGIAFVDLMYAIALYGFRIFDPVPLARQTAISQLREGMLVLDRQGRILSLNPAAERIFGMTARQVKGRLFKELLPACPDGFPADPGGTENEFSLPDAHPPGETLPEGRSLARTPGTARDDEGTAREGVEAGAEIRHYSLEVSLLNDFRGLTIGRLLLLHDVTAQKQAQAQQAQALWAQATLQEREQLADELHDGLSQNLAFLNLQAQAAQLYLQTGQEKSAQTSLSRLTEAAGQIQEDTRELIDHLLSVSLPSENFCTTLRRILADFENQTGMPARLELTGEAIQEDCYDPARLPPPVAVQLVRISQEALANVRKHARGARQVMVELKNTDGQVLLSIQDDGSGFELADQRSNGKHFGLQVMRQRAARIGGRIVIDSTPGGGTRVMVEVPVGKDGETRR